MGVVLNVEVEFPFLDLGPVADVETFVEGGEGGSERVYERYISVFEQGRGLEGVGEQGVDQLLVVGATECRLMWSILYSWLGLLITYWTMLGRRTRIHNQGAISEVLVLLQLA